MKSALIAVGATLLAALAAILAMISSVGRFQPEGFAEFPVGSGLVKARLARSLVADVVIDETEKDPDNATGFPTVVPDSAYKLARDSFLNEPLADDAVAVLAFSAAANGDIERARKMLRASQQISRRDEASSLWLARDAASRGQIGETLTYFDQVLRGSRASRQLLLEQFALATTDPAFGSEMAALMRSNPPWANEFWQVAPTVAPAVRSVGELRLRLAGSGWDFDPGVDAQIASNLIDNGDGELARAIYRAHSPDTSINNGIVINPDFSAPTRFAPVDWQVYQTGDMGAEIVDEDGLLFLSVIASPGGVVARQWIRLAPGRYRLDATMRSEGREAEDQVTLRLRCVTDDTFESRIRIELKEGQTRSNFTVLPESCEDRWLEILPELEEPNPGFDAEISSLEITRLRGATSGNPD